MAQKAENTIFHGPFRAFAGGTKGDVMQVKVKGAERRMQNAGPNHACFHPLIPVENAGEQGWRG